MGSFREKLFELFLYFWIKLDHLLEINFFILRNQFCLVDIIFRVISIIFFIPIFGCSMMVDDGGSPLGGRNGNGLIPELIRENDSVLELALGLGWGELVPWRGDLVVYFVNVEVKQERWIKLWLDVKSQFDGVKNDEFSHLALMKKLLKRTYFRWGLLGKAFSHWIFTSKGRASSRQECYQTILVVSFQTFLPI